VRVPDQVVGDLHAQLAANRLTARRVTQLLEEHGVADLGELASAIHSISERDLRAAIERIPDGSYLHEVRLDGFDEPLVIRLRLDKRGDKVLADYAGSSEQVGRALNVVPSYTFAYTAFALKCAVSPTTPNNDGCFRPLTVIAPEGSLLNPRFPVAVGARALVGHYIPVAVFGALHGVLPESVQAASGSPIWAVNTSGTDQADARFAGVFFLNGGQGASAHHDGVSCLSFPSNISNTPVEVIENSFPVTIERKELIADSGGPGTHRGGLGQHVAIRVQSKGPMSTVFLSERTRFPAEGLLGGGSGALGQVLLNGRVINPKESHVLEPGDLLEVFTPGGGGWGDPRTRARAAVAADVVAGLVSAAQANDVYGLSPESDREGAGTAGVRDRH
jgi:N-methylhydantoinase B